MSGGPSSTQSSTVQKLPKWALPYAQELLGAGANQFLPNGQPAQMPGNLNQQVQPFTPDQLAAMQGVRDQTGAAQGLANTGAGELSDTLSGKDLDPSTNPYLKDTFDQAAFGVTDAYKNATAPSLMAEAQASGAFGGSGFDQKQWENEYGLGQTLDNLGTDVYGGNYANERGIMSNALGQLGNTENSLYAPSNQLLGSGTLQQQQGQTQLDTIFGNALRANQYPMQQLSQFGNILGQAVGNSGTSVSFNPNTSASK